MYATEELQYINLSTETPRLTWFHLTWNSLQQVPGFCLGARKIVSIVQWSLCSVVTKSSNSGNSPIKIFFLVLKCSLGVDPFSQ